MGFLRRKYWVSIAVLLLSMLAAVASFNPDEGIINRSQLVLMFWWGAWMRINLQKEKPPAKVDLVLGLAAVVIMAVVGPHSLARAGLFLLAGGLVSLASQIQFGNRITRRTGDISYGVYILGFPVQQSLIAAFGPEAFSYGGFLALTCVVTFPLALLSWHLVEKYFIRMKYILIPAADSAPQAPSAS